MKKILKKSLICILIVMLISNFIMAIPINPAYAQEEPEETGETKSGLEKLFSGVVGVFTWIPRALLMAIAMGLNSIVTALVVIGSDSVEADGSFFVTPFHVFFNKIEILDVNFLDLNAENTTVKIFREAVAGWYYTMRLIAAMVLVVILIYIGIRMALSTIASEKAMYKKMLVDWACSLALLFLLHYIMIFIFACNTALVNAMGEVVQNTNMEDFMNNLTDNAFQLKPKSVIISFASIAVYAMLVFQTLAFVITYIKRMLTIGFLIIIAPLITITYSIDRIGDGKAQALNTWLKEFTYNILIQPFHCILFLSFAKVAMDLLNMNISGDDASIATAVLAILCIQYIKTGEELVKKIFGFDKAGSLATMAAGTAMAMAAMSKGGQIGQSAGKVVAKGTKVVGKGLGKAGKTLANSKAGKAVGKLGSTAGKAVGSVAQKGKDLVKSTGIGQKVTTKMSERKEKSEAARKEKMKAYLSKQDGMTPEKVKAIMDNPTAPENKAKYDEARKNTSKGHKISSAATKAGKYVANSDLGKYLANNSGKIAGAMVGSVLGAAGLANGAMGMVAGYKAGSGFVEGLTMNSDKTIRKELNGNAQAISNITGETNGGNILSLSKYMGDNEAFKDLGKKMDELMSNLKKIGLGDKNSNTMALSEISKKLLTKPEEVNRDTIAAALASCQGADALSDENRAAAMDLLSNHTVFMAQAALYKNINAAEGRGNTVEDMADTVGTLTPNVGSTTVYEETTVAEPVQDIDVTSSIDVTKLADDVMRVFDPEARKVVDDINSRTQDIENLLRQIETASDSQKSDLVEALKINMKDDSLDITQLESQLRTELTNLQNQS